MKYSKSSFGMLFFLVVFQVDAQEASAGPNEQIAQMAVLAPPPQLSDREREYCRNCT